MLGVFAVLVFTYIKTSIYVKVYFANREKIPESHLWTNALGIHFQFQEFNPNLFVQSASFPQIST